MDNDTLQLSTPPQVAKYLGVPVGTLAAWRYRKKGPAYIKVGRHVRYRQSDVEAWLDTQQGAS